MCATSVSFTQLCRAQCVRELTVAAIPHAGEQGRRRMTRYFYERAGGGHECNERERERAGQASPRGCLSSRVASDLSLPALLAESLLRTLFISLLPSLHHFLPCAAFAVVYYHKGPPAVCGSLRAERFGRLFLSAALGAVVL